MKGDLRSTDRPSFGVHDRAAERDWGGQPKNKLPRNHFPAVGSPRETRIGKTVLRAVKFKAGCVRRQHNFDGAVSVRLEFRAAEVFIHRNGAGHINARCRLPLVRR